MLLTHRHAAHGDIVAGLTAALAAGSTSPELVAIEARKAAARRAGVADTAAVDQPRVVVELAPPRCTLLVDPRPVPSLAGYDQLLLVQRGADPPS